MKLDDILRSGAKKIKRKKWSDFNWCIVNGYDVAREVDGKRLDPVVEDLIADDWEEYTEQKKKKIVKLYRETLFRDGTYDQIVWASHRYSGSSRIVATEEKEIEVDE